MIIPVHAPNGDYDIILEEGALGKVDAYLNLERKVLVVTDSGVPAEYAAGVAAKCKTPVLVTLPEGEATKCMASFEKLLAAMLEAGFTRGDCVVAVGGGVVGDLSAFAASCYMRGIDFYNIPTTLLSQVDSSVGGKTGIDFGGVKNIVGSFYQPKAVIIDPLTLNTLDDRKLHEGLAEAIKVAATCDAALFARIEESTNLRADLMEIIAGAVTIKKNVVEEDPKEQGLRKVLNFGHTIGHAVEAADGGLLHGECVAIGMPPLCDGPARERILQVLNKYNLPTTTAHSAQDLLPYLKHDKKSAGDIIHIVYVTEIGSFAFRDLTPPEILELMEKTI